ncbi:hypothetical protein NGM37_01820, partial [Streptomyces sp. TRM76130]|nr:hypothetical protein [Streptomyces sp. TRM76130]
DETRHDAHQGAPRNDPPGDLDHPSQSDPSDDRLAATGELPAVAPLLDGQEEVTPAADVPQDPATGTRAGTRAAARAA